MSNKFFLPLFFFAFFTEVSLYTNKVKTNPKKDKGEFQLKTEYVDFSRMFLEQSMQTLKQYPGICLTGMLSALSYNMYAEDIKKFLYSNREVVVSSSAAAVLLAYVTRNKWMKYLPSVEEETEDEEDESSDQNMYAFSRTPVRIFRPGEIKTVLEDVAGLQTAKEDLMDVAMFLKDPEQFEKIGAKIPKGILLHGSPGNGKTLLARALAGEVVCPFLYVNASQFEEAFVGIGAARIRYLFAIAKQEAPCIIFIDEIDCIGRKRSMSSQISESGQSLNQLLAELDGFEQQKDPIVIIGATNRPDVLDSALTRPGRFDRKVEIAAPFVNDRYKILELHLKSVQAEDNLDVYKIARGTPGYSGADLAHLINEAAIIALRDGATKVSMLHLDHARDYINLGRETKGMNISDEEYWQTAVHEAGHALARVLQKDAMPLHKVTITPRGGALGITFGMHKESYHQFEQELKAEIVVKLAGSVAEEMIFAGRGVGASSDLKAARALATEMVMVYGMTEEFKDVTFSEYVNAQVHLPDEIATKLQKEVAKIIHECRQIAVDILTIHKDQLVTLVDMLVEQETVFGSDVYQLCGIQEPNIEYSLT